MTYIPKLSVRLVKEGKMKYSVDGPLNSPDVIYRQFAKLFKNKMQEEMVVVFLNSQLMPVGMQVAGVGSGQTCIVDKSAIFRTAILSGAYGIIMMHNHPSGSTAESEQDIDITKEMIKVGKLLSIPVLDHIIVTDTSYNSMRESEKVRF